VLNLRSHLDPPLQEINIYLIYPKVPIDLPLSVNNLQLSCLQVYKTH
jgi:hypothetical protein